MLQGHRFADRIAVKPVALMKAYSTHDKPATIQDFGNPYLKYEIRNANALPYGAFPFHGNVPELRTRVGFHQLDS